MERYPDRDPLGKKTGAKWRERTALELPADMPPEPELPPRPVRPCPGCGGELRFARRHYLAEEENLRRGVQGGLLMLQDWNCLAADVYVCPACRHMELVWPENAPLPEPEPDPVEAARRELEENRYEDRTLRRILRDPSRKAAFRWAAWYILKERQEAQEGGQQHGL